MKKLIVILSTVLLTSCAAMDPVSFATSVASNVTSTRIYAKVFGEEKKPEPPKAVEAPKPAPPPAPVKKEPESIVEQAVEEVKQVAAPVVESITVATAPVVQAVKTTTEGISWMWYALAGLIGLLVMRKFKKK